MSVASLIKAFEGIRESVPALSRYPLVLAPPQFTSQKCSACGHIHADNRPSQAVFHCQACGYTENADTNAAKNILGEGLSLLACPEKDAALIGHREPVQSDRSLKQGIRSWLVA